ncbi:MAG: hypothetical protein ACYC0X_32705 [Pirellulaceae bacterium]
MANSQESNSTLQGSLQTDGISPSPPRSDRITRWLLIAIGIYSVLLVSFLNLIVLNSDNVKDRAIILMVRVSTIFEGLLITIVEGCRIAWCPT